VPASRPGRECEDWELWMTYLFGPFPFKYMPLACFLLAPTALCRSTSIPSERGIFAGRAILNVASNLCMIPAVARLRKQELRWETVFPFKIAALGTDRWPDRRHIIDCRSV
jgi:uncharacterized membrane protein YraQ (UPF0718 family)